MRYLPLSTADRTAMLATIGAASVDDLFQDVPAEAVARTIAVTRANIVTSLRFIAFG